MEIQIVPYSEAHRPYFKSLNKEWLEKYFKVEPIDTRMLSNPQVEIIDKGGHIFYVAADDAVVGTAALLKVDKDTYELAKMAVTEKFQGHGLGKRLLEHSIELAKELGANTLILYSNTKLITAIALYRKFGFTEAPLDSELYERANIKMTLSPR